MKFDSSVRPPQAHWRTTEECGKILGKSSAFCPKLLQTAALKDYSFSGNKARSPSLDGYFEKHYKLLRSDEEKHAARSRVYRAYDVLRAMAKRQEMKRKRAAEKEEIETLRKRLEQAQAEIARLKNLLK